MSFEADVASITRSASGIGRIIVFQFARESAKLIYAGQSLEGHLSSVKLPRNPQICTPNICDAPENIRSYALVSANKVYFLQSKRWWWRFASHHF
jgi:NADP-dependent 3-hydroxy acid dehydrogenase YdfG